MKSQLFKKAAVFSDIHYGAKNNSRQHNSDCEEFVLWFIEQAKANNCETCIFGGDFHHHRAAINVSTLNYTVSAMKFLSDAFENVYMLTGNHDLYYREKREIHSFPYATNHSNIHIINNEPIVLGQVGLVPWLVGDEWKKVKSMKAKYIFGHFELPSFLMNAAVSMPDHGGLNADHLTGPDYVFSGHFHKRQKQKNIHYLGSPFPHNFGDAWDDERGMMILEWNGDPHYINWTDMPKYITINLSDLIDNPDQYLSNRTYARVFLDIPISYEESNFIKETLTTQYNLRDLSLQPKKNTDSESEWKGSDEIKVENVDSIVFTQLKSVESEFIDNKKLMDIYSKL